MKISLIPLSYLINKILKKWINLNIKLKELYLQSSIVLYKEICNGFQIIHLSLINLNFTTKLS